MVLHGGGFTFIPKSAVRNGTLPTLVSQLFTSRNEVLLYIQKKDESQTYTLIQQLAQESHTPLVVLLNTHTGYFCVKILNGGVNSDNGYDWGYTYVVVETIMMISFILL